MKMAETSSIPVTKTKESKSSKKQKRAKEETADLDTLSTTDESVESSAQRKHKAVKGDKAEKKRKYRNDDIGAEKASKKHRKDSKKSHKEDTTASDVSTPARDEASIENFDISEKNKAVLKRRGITTLFPIQVKTFAHVLAGKNVVGRARTGTGKTLAFTLPALEQLERDRTLNNSKDIRMLVLLPTRELAQQVAAEIGPFESDNVRVTAIVGGLPENPQLIELRSKKPNIVVATPGRALDFVKRDLLHLTRLRILVLDEADQMLEMGFREDVDAIFATCFPASNHPCSVTFDDDGEPNSNTSSGTSEQPPSVQVLLFTATLPSWIHDLSRNYMKQRPKVTIDIVGDTNLATAAAIEHISMSAPGACRASLLPAIVARYAGSHGKVIVFAETKQQANAVALESPIANIAQPLHGDIPQAQREATLTAFKAGKFRVLVATDVAARGLHIDDVALVVQLDLAKDIDTFVHRTGRTGRAGNAGIAVAFFNPGDAPYIKSIEKQTGCKFTRAAVPQPGDTVRVLATTIADEICSSKAPKLLPGLMDVADNLVATLTPQEAVARLLQRLTTSDNGSVGEGKRFSALTGRQDLKSYHLIFFVEQRSARSAAWNALRRLLGPKAEEVTANVSCMFAQKNNMGVVFDLAAASIASLEDAISNADFKKLGFSIAPLSELPELDDPLFNMGLGRGEFTTKNPNSINARRGRLNSQGGRGGFNGRGGPLNRASSHGGSSRGGSSRGGFRGRRGRGF